MTRTFSLAAFALFSAAALHAQPLEAQRLEAKLSVSEQFLLAAANQERANQGLGPVHLDPVLTAASVYHAQQMAAHQDISHQFDDEPELAERGAKAGAHFSLITENVGEAPTSVIIHDLWMNSPGHRANLLDPHVDSIGIAVITRDDELYAVEDFANTIETLSLTQQEHSVANVIAQSGLQVTESLGAARETCTMSTGYAGPRQPRYIVRYTADSLDKIPSQLKARLNSGKYREAAIGACSVDRKTPFTAYNIAVLLFP
ncbi:MAG: CAP domain-containing protein [Acidobacteriota bacterium]|nr:CAP domain-containing protein [Acidobacteriota bacterium]